MLEEEAKLYDYITANINACPFYEAPDFDQTTQEEKEDFCDIQLSLCGHILNQQSLEEREMKESEMFEVFSSPEHLITFQLYSENPSSILADPRLVVCIDDQFYEFKQA